MRLLTTFLILFVVSLALFDRLVAGDEAAVLDGVHKESEVRAASETADATTSSSSAKTEGLAASVSEESDRTVTADQSKNSTADTGNSEGSKTETAKAINESSPPVQAGPFIDLLGPTLLSLEMIDEQTAQFKQHYTNEALRGKKVVGLYFSADW